VVLAAVHCQEGRSPLPHLSPLALPTKTTLLLERFFLRHPMSHSKSKVPRPSRPNSCSNRNSVLSSPLMTERRVFLSANLVGACKSFHFYCISIFGFTCSCCSILIRCYPRLWVQYCWEEPKRINLATLSSMQLQNASPKPRKQSEQIMAQSQSPRRGDGN
jgi:hypothetical protein